MGDSIEIRGLVRHPYERALLDLIEHHLKRNNWPSALLKLELAWSVRQKWFGEHNLKGVKLIEGRPSGMVKLQINFLYLTQRPDKFLTLAVPHLLTHVYADLKAMRRGLDMENPHNDVFQGEMIRFSDLTPKRHSDINVWFDDRPYRLWKGGVPTKCKCEGESAFAVAYGKEEKSKLVAAEWICERCQVPYQRVPRDQMPAAVEQDVEYISEEKCHR